MRHLYIKTIILPRQARDKHRETQKKSGVFRSVQRNAVSNHRMRIQIEDEWSSDNMTRQRITRTIYVVCCVPCAAYRYRSPMLKSPLRVVRVLVAQDRHQALGIWHRSLSNRLGIRTRRLHCLPRYAPPPPPPNACLRESSIALSCQCVQRRTDTRSGG
eukprot:COSAG06_NODE_5689_length_3318_cov_24.544337_3_plen_159_part_00